MQIEILYFPHLLIVCSEYIKVLDTPAARKYGFKKKLKVRRAHVMFWDSSWLSYFYTNMTLY